MSLAAFTGATVVSRSPWKTIRGGNEGTGVCLTHRGASSARWSQDDCACLRPSASVGGRGLADHGLGVIAEDQIGDAALLVSALDLVLKVIDDLDSACYLEHLSQGHAHARTRANRQWRREPYPVEPVIEDRGDVFDCENVIEQVR
jgi:hypothetical protein